VRDLTKSDKTKTTLPTKPGEHFSFKLITNFKKSRAKSPWKIIQDDHFTF
jgi:hypothetical protein